MVSIIPEGSCFSLIKVYHELESLFKFVFSLHKNCINFDKVKEKDSQTLVKKKKKNATLTVG